MLIHKMNNLKQKPVCWGNDFQPIAVQMAQDIDQVTCVDCLRMLAKDAVLYGRDRKPGRKW